MRTMFAVGHQRQSLTTIVIRSRGTRRCRVGGGVAGGGSATGGRAPAGERVTTGGRVTARGRRQPDERVAAAAQPNDTVSVNGADAGGGDTGTGTMLRERGHPLDAQPVESLVAGSGEAVHTGETVH